MVSARHQFPDGARRSIAVVTGASSGIGAATVARLLDARWRVVAVDLEPPVDDEHADDEHADDATLGRVRLDVADPGEWSRLAASMRDRGEAPSFLHLNAGVSSRQPRILELTDEQYRRTVDVNLGGVVFGIREIAPLLAPGGSIVVTASVAAMRPSPLDPVYAATKHAVVGLVRSVADELGERGLRIHAVCPGVTDTPLVRGNPLLLERVAVAGAPLLHVDDIVDGVVAALSSEHSGDAWVVTAGRPPYRYEWPSVDG